MKIAVASDHAGFALKKSIVEKLAQENHEVYDLGPFLRIQSVLAHLPRQWRGQSLRERQSGGFSFVAPVVA